MYEKYPNAARGLNWMFIAEILTLISVPLMAIAIGGLTALAATVLNLVGLYTATHDDPGYFPAIYAAVADLVLGVIGNALGEGIPLLNFLLYVVSTLLELFIVYRVITTTLNLLGGRNGTLALRGGYVIKIYAVCTLVVVVCMVLSIIPIVDILAAVVSIVAAIAMVVGYVFYLLFLRGASKARA